MNARCRIFVSSNLPIPSPLQARKAFSVYLQRVQARLLEESSGAKENTDEAREDEQMELVLRFLRRAAANLPSDSFTVVAPSKRLALRDRLIAGCDVRTTLRLHN